MSPKYATLIALSCLVGGCSMVGSQPEPGTYAGNGYYPPAHVSFVENMQLDGVQETDGLIRMSYTQSVTREEFDQMVNLLTAGLVWGNNLHQFCENATSFGFPSAISNQKGYAALDVVKPRGQLEVVLDGDLLSAQVRTYMGTKSSVAVNPEYCAGGALEWVYLDTPVTRQIGWLVESPRSVHVNMNGRFAYEITPGFTPVGDAKDLTSYGIFLAVGTHMVNVPVDANPRVKNATFTTQWFDNQRFN